MKLYICGNGFDLSHGLNTSYSAYKSFLEKNDPKVLKGYESFPYLDDTDSQWSDIESALNIDYESALFDAVNLYYPNVADNDSDSRWYEIELNLDELTRFIYLFTGERYFSWLYQVDTGCAVRKLSLEKSDYYINFNYTDTLENVYDIPEDHVFHIHGSLNDVIKHNMILQKSVVPSFTSNEEAEILEDIPADKFNSDMVRQFIQFGAVGITPKDVYDNLEKSYKDDEFYGASIEPAIRQLELFCEKTSKNLQNNYAPLHNFIKDLDVDEVIIMGHSIRGVDSPYYKEILVPQFKTVKWTFMCHSDNENNKINEFVSEFGIGNYEIVWW